jgi:hypothetical protein
MMLLLQPLCRDDGGVDVDVIDDDDVLVLY